MRGRRVLKVGLWALGVAALLAGAGAALEAWLVPQGVRVAAERAVRDAAGGGARIAGVRVNLWRGQVRLLGVEARGIALGGLDVDVAVEEVRLHVGRRALVGGTLQVRAVTLDRPEVGVRVGSAAPGAATGGLTAPLAAAHVTVRRGRVTYEAPGQALRIDAGGIEATIARRPEGAEVSVRLAGGRVAVAGRTIPLGAVGVEGIVRLAELHLARLTAEAPGFRLRAGGRVGWAAARPAWELGVEGTADAGEIARLAAGGLPASGQVAFAGTLKGIGRDAAFRGEVKAPAVTLAGHTVRSAAGRVVIDARRVRLEGVRFTLWDGALRVDGACLWASGRCEARAQGRDLDLAQAAAGAAAGGRIGGTATFAGVPGRPETRQATLSLRGTAVRAGALTLGGLALEAGLEGDRLEAEGSALGGTAPFRLSGRWRPDLALDVSLEAADLRGVALAPGQPRLGGALRATGTLSGPWADPSLSGKITWARAEFAGLTWDSAEGSVKLAPGGVVVDSAAFRAGKTALHLKGTARPGRGADPGLLAPVLDLAGEGEGTVEDLARIAGLELTAAGQFRMTVRVRGAARRPEGEARFLLQDFSIGRTRWERGEARARLAAGAVRLEAVTLQHGAARLEASGELAEDGRLALDVTASDLDLATLAGAPALAGTLSGKGRLSGSVADPAVDATVRLSAVAWDGVPLGSLSGRLTHTAGRTDVGLREERGRLSLTATLAGGADGTVELSLSAQEMDATPLLARSGDPRLAAARGRAGGTARLTIPLARPQEASGEARLALAEITVAGETWRAEGPVEVQLTPQAAQIPSAVLRGRLGSVRLSGSVRQGGRAEWAIQGPVPLATAALWARGIEGSGTATLNLTASGVAGAVESRGSIHLLAERMRIAGFPWELERVDCPGVLEGAQATFGPCRAAMSGGTLTGTGRLERRGPPQWDHRWDVRLEGAQADQLAGALGTTAGKITGSAAGTAELAFLAGEGADTLQTLRGPVRLRFQDGRLFRGAVLSKVLELLNASPVRRWRLPDLTGAGMAYRELTAVAHLEGGVVDLGELHLDGDALRLAGAGSVDLAGRKLQMILAVRPLVLVDDVVGRVPLLGPVLAGKGGGVLTVTYEASGPLDDPTVRLAGARTAGRNVLDRLLKLLEGTERKP